MGEPQALAPGPDDDPRQIILGCTCTHEAFGPFLAEIMLAPSLILRLLNLIDAFRAAEQIENDLYELSIFDHSPEWFEHSSSTEADKSAEVDALFAAECDLQPDQFHWAARSMPALAGNGVTDYTLLYVRGEMADEVPRRLMIRWVMCIKHTTLLIESAELPEALISAAMERHLAGER